MIWFSKINSDAFKKWMIHFGSRSVLRQGKPLDPFGTSMRKFNNAQSWIKEIADTGNLTLTTARATDQAKTDLKSTHLIDQFTMQLSSLGHLTYNDWLKYNIPENDKDYEIHRCLILLKNAISLNDNLYKNYIGYWKELRLSFTFENLISNPEHLYFFAFFNKSYEGYNPYLAIKGLGMNDKDFPTTIDWEVIKQYYRDSNLNKAADKFKGTIDGIVSRQGRSNFVTAIEIISNISSSGHIISRLPLDTTKKDLLTIIVKGILNQPSMTLNQILYGPPGTGKTHNSINHALSIIEDKNVEEIIKEQRNDASIRTQAKERFDKYVETGQIQFVTFHQSYSYEDFVEGIKSVVNTNGDVEYRIEDGIFKRICIQAGKTGSHVVEFEEAYDQFVSEVNNSASTFSLNTIAQNKPFDIKISPLGNTVAVARTTNATPMTVSKNNLRRYVETGTIKEWPSYTKPIGDYIKTKYIDTSATVNNSGKKYVLIIDEINRGNISKIFGELITLIEGTKRIGKEEELKVKLTYSGTETDQTFGIPLNLYIVGTMNSADKSIALVDTALRRRFEFIEYAPDHTLLNDNIEGINLQELLRTINSRIEILLDKDHKIGHAYLINIKSKNQLCEVFRNKILPLLEEYFYGDYEKIQLVLGDNPEYNKSKDKNVIVANSASEQRNLFGKDIDGFEEKTIYSLNENIINQTYDNLDSEFFTSIYVKTPKS